MNILGLFGIAQNPHGGIQHLCAAIID